MLQIFYSVEDISVCLFGLFDFNDGISVPNRVSEQMMVFNVPLTAIMVAPRLSLEIRTSDPMLTSAPHPLIFQKVIFIKESGPIATQSSFAHVYLSLSFFFFLLIN